MAVTLFFINNRKVEKCSRVSFLVNCNFEEVDSFVQVFAELVKQDTNVEISLEIFGVNGKRSLVKTVALFERFICRWRFLKFNALRKTVKPVYIVRVLG